MSTNSKDFLVKKMLNWFLHWNLCTSHFSSKQLLHILVKVLIWQFKKGAKTGNQTIMREYMSLSVSVSFFVSMLFTLSMKELEQRRQSGSCPMGTNEIWGLKNLGYWIMISSSSNSSLLSKHLAKKSPLNIFISKSGPEYFLWGGYYINLVNNSSLGHFNYLNLAQRQCVRLKWDTSGGKDQGVPSCDKLYDGVWHRFSCSLSKQRLTNVQLLRLP